MNDDTFLYNKLMSSLFTLDSKHHSCLNDLVFLKDYRKVMTTKLPDEDEFAEELKGKYASIYRQDILAERMRRYLEDNIIEHYEINQWELFIRLRNNDQFVYDGFYNVITFNSYGDELTDEQELKELRKNLKKMLDRRFMTQEELANEVGVDRKTINRYLNGDRIPDAIVLVKIAKALKCSVMDLYYRTH